MDKDRLHNAINNIMVEEQEVNDNFAVYLGDSVQICKGFPDHSLDFQIFSPPFSSLYIYSESVRDMGNCKDDEEFFAHFDFLIPELFRTLRAGRLCAVHCKDLVDYKGRDGQAGLRDFPGDIIRSMQKHGFKYHSKVTIWTDPVFEMQRTKSQGLLYKQLRKDSTFSRVGLPDYLILFRKAPDGVHDKPVNHYASYKDLAKLVGKESISFGDEQKIIPLSTWQELASPVWMTINRMDVLNKVQAKGNKDEKHICPLQLDVIERALTLWTNPGDVVYDPFGGIGSTLYQSLKEMRRPILSELKKEYYDVSKLNAERALTERMTLF